MTKDDKSVKNWELHQKVNSKGETIPETVQKFEYFDFTKKEIEYKKIK